MPDDTTHDDTTELKTAGADTSGTSTSPPAPPALPAYDKLGSFYLGREHDLATGETSTRPLLYKSKDLTTHAVCVGMTGSGKTGLCLGLLEEAALDGVPAIAIDPKGDLGNLLLAFPELRPEDFRPWIDESEAARKGKTPDEYAEFTAELWRKGLADWDQAPERIQRFCDSVERVIYTPGSNAGIPLTVLKSFDAPPQALRDDVDAMRERVQSATSGLLALLGIDADPVQSREHIFLSNLLNHAWNEGRDLSVAELIRQIQKPPFQQVGIMDIDTFYPAKNRTTLAMKLNNLLASPSFAGWMQGEPLNIQKLLYNEAGKPRLAILSIAHLNDAERMFFVTILLNELVAWMRTQPGTGSLRAILYMDEVFGYFPPVGEPPSKRPMLTLLKQARAFGLGCVLSTQNPVDLDYKGLSNCGTWFLGRLQTERDKARVMDGLQGAAAQVGSGFNKRAMEAKLAALGSRVFLMNNVHEDAPVIFHTRWAMSYLRGPLTRGAIKKLMDRFRGRGKNESRSDSTTADAAAENSPKSAAAQKNEAPLARPLLPGDMEERFVPFEGVVPEGSELVYRPILWAEAKLHFVKASHEVDRWRDFRVQQPLLGEPANRFWEEANVVDQDLPAAKRIDLHREPEDDFDCKVTFAPLPPTFTRQASYKSLAKDLEEHLYRTQTLDKWHCKPLDAYSELGEAEGDFRVRLRMQAREARDEAIETVDARYQKKIAKAQKRVDKAQAYYDEQNSQFWGRVGGFVWTVVELILAVVSGGKSSRRSSSSATAARQAATERGQAKRAKKKLAAATADRDLLEQEQNEDLEQLRQQYGPEQLQLTPIKVTPRKSDIDITQLWIAWQPEIASRKS